MWNIEKKDPEIAALEDDLQRHLGTKVVAGMKGHRENQYLLLFRRRTRAFIDMLRSL